MDPKAARSSFFAAYLEDTWQKIAEVRQREALILVKKLILDTLLVPYFNWTQLSIAKPVPILKPLIYNFDWKLSQ